MPKFSPLLAAACFAIGTSCVPLYPPDSAGERPRRASYDDPLDLSEDPPPETHDISPPVEPGESAKPKTEDKYPTAEPTTNPDRVLSPYEPFNLIDVTGFKSGQLARDPSNKKIFRVP
jgi:hypothetical protein